MTPASSLSVKIGALVHPSALADPAAFSLHRSIIATRLLMGLFVLAAAPLCLSLDGVPRPWAILCFFWLLLPLAAVALLSRTGRLAETQAITAASIIGFALTLGLSGGLESVAAFAWLPIAPMEAAFSLRRRLVLLAGLLAAGAAIVLVAKGHFSAGAGDVWRRPQLAILIASAAAYAARLACHSIQLMRSRERMERFGAARFDSLSGALGDLVMHHDRSGAVLFASRECEPLFSLSPRDLMGRGFFERVHVADRPAFLSSVSDAAACDRTIPTTLRLRVSASTEAQVQEEPRFAWVELRARRLASPTDPAGTVVVSVVRDVTAVKRHERELEEARLEAERASAWKDRFLANVSHELRTPLNCIIGFSEMLCSEELAPRDPVKQREYAQIIHSSGQHLLSVVNSILDMSKIEAGQFDILLEPFEVRPLIDSCCDILRLNAEQGGVELIQDCPRGLPELVADKRACKQILINLLSNAIKFTQAGGRVTIGARAEGNSIVLFVSDTGIGIGAPDLPHIGSAFFQARAAYDRPFAGTGLGLSVVRGLVGLHGGAMQLESAPGEGTSVTVRLPREGRPVAALAPPAKIDVVVRSVRSQPFSGLSVVKKIA